MIDDLPDLLPPDDPGGQSPDPTPGLPVGGHNFPVILQDKDLYVVDVADFLKWVNPQWVGNPAQAGNFSKALRKNPISVGLRDIHMIDEPHSNLYRMWCVMATAEFEEHFGTACWTFYYDSDAKEWKAMFAAGRREKTFRDLITPYQLYPGQCPEYENMMMPPMSALQGKMCGWNPPPHHQAAHFPNKYTSVSFIAGHGNYNPCVSWGLLLKGKE